jgi:hypothetical protein
MTLSKRSMRNLKQYKHLPEEEFEKIYQQLVSDVASQKVFEERIQEKLNELAEDYDLNDLNANDILMLRNMIQAMIQIENLEQLAFQLRSGSIDEHTINLLGKINTQINDLVDRVSKIQNDLNITRKARKQDKEQSVVDYIEFLKQKANEFYKQKMQYIFCPNCNVLLGTIWTLYPEDKRNKVVLHCNRKLDDDVVCDTKVVFIPAENLSKEMTNNPDLMFDGMQ